MRLALVTETFPPEVNGVSMTLGRLVNGLAGKGYQVQVVRPSQVSDLDEMGTSDSLYDELVMPGMPLPGYEGLRMGRPEGCRLLREWTAAKPDLVHVATEGPLGLAALWVARVLQIPTSSTFHTNFHQYTGHYKIGLIKDFILVFLRITHNSCGCTLAPTKQMADELKAMGFKNTSVLSRGVDTELFSPDRRDEQLRAEWGAAPEDRVVAYVGRVASEKNIDLAVKAFRRSQTDSRKSIMVIVGDGPERLRLQTKYPDIVFAGMRKGEDLARHYASGDIFLFPSITETFGNVVTEALSSGLAVVTYDYAAGRELIESGVDGLLATFDQPDQFIESARVAMGLDAEALSTLRMQARETAMAVSWDRVIQEFKQSLEIVKNRDRKMYANAL